MMRPKRYYIFVTFLFILHFYGISQHIPDLINYKVSEYKAHNQNWSVSQSDDRWMYFGNTDGLLAFNGNLWTKNSLKENKGERLFGPNGFYDAFNGNQNWVADSYLAIDQGPILAMIQNHRTELLWKMFMKNPEIKPALDAIGFVPDNTSSTETIIEDTWTISPNPATDFLTLTFGERLPYQVTVSDITGKMYLSMSENITQDMSLPVELLENGVYIVIADYIGQGKSSKLLVKNF